MAASSGDGSPCRWAAALKLHETHPDVQLVDLSPSEQRSRGQELLRLLWEPVTPRASTPPMPCLAPGTLGSTTTAKEFEADPWWHVSDTNVLVRNTFIELVASPSTRIRRRKSDSEIVIPAECQRWRRAYDQHIENFSLCPDDRLCQKNAEPSQGCSFPKCHTLHKLSEHAVLNLSACLGHTEYQKNEDHELSDASTDTPREPTDEISMYDMFDTTQLEEIAPAAGGSCRFHAMFPQFPANSQVGVFSQSTRSSQQEAWQRPPFVSQLMPARELAFCPNTPYDDAFNLAPRQAMSENPLSSAWQWTSQFAVAR